MGCTSRLCLTNVSLHQQLLLKKTPSARARADHHGRSLFPHYPLLRLSRGTEMTGKTTVHCITHNLRVADIQFLSANQRAYIPYIDNRGGSVAPVRASQSVIK